MFSRSDVIGQPQVLAGKCRVGVVQPTIAEFFTSRFLAATNPKITVAGIVCSSPTSQITDRRGFHEIMKTISSAPDATFLNFVKHCISPNR